MLNINVSLLCFLKNMISLCKLTVHDLNLYEPGLHTYRNISQLFFFYSPKHTNTVLWDATQYDIDHVGRGRYAPPLDT